MEVTSHATTAKLCDRLDRSLTVNEFSQQVIDHFLSRITHYQAAVLADQDTEPLHKMRVALRRLRTILQVLRPLLVLPDAVSDQSIGKLARVLGAVRDLDIMAAQLQAVAGELPAAEQQILHSIDHSLHRHRQQAFARLKKYLSKHYRSILIAGQQWTKQPQYCHPAIADQPLTNFLADLLLPNISEFFLHPGWWITTVELHDQQGILHDLRKSTKRLRYQTECFAGQLITNNIPVLATLETSQESLGQMQDAVVLRDFIRQELGKKNMKQLPLLGDRLEHSIHQAWQDWQPVREELGDRAWRQSFRQAIVGLTNPDGQGTIQGGSDQTLLP
jgi:CHAD domain-containing protein